ncbi:MAG: 8-amino-7-oxononanoate synthase [Planctomycetia bacterium]|jgi:8-amino-7-oxononanoate synthase
MPLSPAEIQKRLSELQEKGLLRELRELPQVGGIIPLPAGRIVNLSSNDYLDLAQHPEVTRAAAEAATEWGGGATASRLMAGNHSLFGQIERDLAQMCGTEDSLVFGSGYLLNLGVLTTLARRQDVLFADKLNHASLIDGMKLCDAKTYRYRHLDMDHLDQLLCEQKPAAEGGLQVIVSDTVFSMDGDFAPVAELVEIAERHDAALILDEAHAIGIFGPEGGGLLRQAGLQEKADVVLGTMSKALGSYGGFAACSARMKKLLINHARPFIFSTGLPPAVLAAGRASIAIIQKEYQNDTHPGSDNPLAKGLGRELIDRCDFFRSLLAEQGIDYMPTTSQIIPIHIGDNFKALSIAETLRDQNIFATAIRPPTVPVGTARLRMSVTLAHSEEDLREVAEKLAEVMRGSL